MPDLFLKKTEVCTLFPVPPAGVDNHISIDGSAANWSSITSENFLAGPKPGQEQVLIKVGNKTAKVAEGQRLEEIQKRNWLHVYDTATENADFEFDKHRNSTVGKNDTLTVQENQNVTIKNNQTVNVKELRRIDAKNVQEVVGEKIYIKAGVELLLEGPGNGIIKIDREGITIQGVIVKIN